MTTALKFDPCTQAALAVEEERALAVEMAEWAAAAVDGGFGDPDQSIEEGVRGVLATLCALAPDVIDSHSETVRQ
jgi:hypothetical protein